MGLQQGCRPETLGTVIFKAVSYTHLGPMDVLKHHKKSIDFLSEDHEIYSWTTSGNYSPSKLYRNGMIEGSPFNIDSIDFIGIFGSGEEDE